MTSELGPTVFLLRGGDGLVFGAALHSEWHEATKEFSAGDDSKIFILSPNLHVESLMDITQLVMPNSRYIDRGLYSDISQHKNTRLPAWAWFRPRSKALEVDLRHILTQCLMVAPC